ncbi:hypothetical protein [Kiritimatiella glycovorans]|uniref:hypothetical protein n=1 Tax=Kiritimatiella glycovorans TaxID=1307763 RepID=UPI002FFBF217
MSKGFKDAIVTHGGLLSGWFAPSVQHGRSGDRLQVSTVNGTLPRVGLGPFYALLGALTAIMSWLTDAGVSVEFMGLTFMVGSTVFYTSLLLGVFVVYAFDGPPATRLAILTVAGVSALTPLVAAVIHFQFQFSDPSALAAVPVPSLRINSASVLTTIADLLFLAMIWEVFGRAGMKMRLWLRTYLTLLGVMWIDVILFATGAFGGTPGYLSIMTGTFSSRFIISLIAFPFLYFYLNRENRRTGADLSCRPVLAIIKEVAEVRAELTLAQEEIERRKQAEAEKEALIEKQKWTLENLQRLEGLLSVCSNCRRIRLRSENLEWKDEWLPLEEYIRQRTNVRFSHGICKDCMKSLYPEEVERESGGERGEQAPDDDGDPEERP